MRQTTQTKPKGKRQGRPLPPWAVPCAVALLALVSVLATLFWGQNAGLSDNGDFARVMEVNRIHPTGDGQSSFLFQQYYVMDVAEGGLLRQVASLFETDTASVPYWSPQFVPIQISKVLNLAYNHIVGNPVDGYNLGFLAVLYALLLALAVWLCVRHLPRGTWRKRFFAAVLLLGIFCDAGYVLYFHSFYGEALQMVTLMLAVGLWLRLFEDVRRPLAWVALYVTLYFFGGAKLANIPIACLFGAASLLLLVRGSSALQRTVSAVLCAALLVSQAALYTAIPDWMQNDTNYQAVFFGVLKNSDTPEQDLQELGLDPAYAVLAGTHAYQPSYPMDIYSDAFRNGFYPNVSKVRVLGFYLRHPSRLLDKMDTALMCSAYIRPPYLGNLSSSRLKHVSRNSGWSWLRVHSRVLYQFPVVLPALLLASLFALWRTLQCLRGKRPLAHLAGWGALLALCAATWAAWILPIVGNGEADLSKHMFLLIHLLDLLVAVTAVAIAPLLLHAIRWCRRNPKRAAVCAGGFAAVVLTVVLFAQQPRLPLVQFGTFENKPLLWEVVRDEGDTMTLVCRDIVAKRPFDENGSNLWSESTLRGWLGSTFLAQFSPEELQRLVPCEVRELLSQPYMGQSEGGEHALFWHFDPRKAADLAGQSYYKMTLDTVYLPTPELFGSFTATCGEDYWMLAPYGNNAEMERVVQTDGFILFRDAEEVAGVRPAVTVRK